MGKRTFTKDVHYLYKKINSFSAGQATVHNWEDEKGVTIEIAPSDGYYRGGKFKFLISPRSDEDYPDMPPNVVCLTDIYHPNIDMEDDEYRDEEDISNICVSLLESGEWTGSMTLEDCVQAILFLFYNPNWGDALSPLFSADLQVEQFIENVRTSMKGGCVENRIFERNYGMCNNETDDDVVEQEKFELEMNDLNKSKQTEAESNNELLIENVANALVEKLTEEIELIDAVENLDVSNAETHEINTGCNLGARDTNTESDADTRETSTEGEVGAREMTTEAEEGAREMTTEKVTLQALPNNCGQNNNIDNPRGNVFKRSLSVGDSPKECTKLTLPTDLSELREDGVSNSLPPVMKARTQCFDFDNLMPCSPVLTALCSYISVNITNTVSCS